MRLRSAVLWVVLSASGALAAPPPDFKKLCAQQCDMMVKNCYDACLDETGKNGDGRKNAPLCKDACENKMKKTCEKECEKRAPK